ncbi:Protein of unknown function DUF2078, membrane [Ferroglobus placidus DSM 10642]|uniref:SHOCT domain-containing protein n=1 Tax=Ferroglobus placidus (strain DSM 10642 / AEDII12DO) TaxID=589924 RepID=D3RWU6_FERPA|nr:SHOCT domain-containing protein [Ferroglobus placidus]ADC64959.1 Protein of unknown function DUF2078, membrane [Ferroglobus placidus DSM 10642]
MMGYGMMGGMMGNNFGGWYFGSFVWQILWLAIIVAVIYILMNSLSSGKKSEDMSLQILKERLARGEISQEEYIKLKDALSRS